MLKFTDNIACFIKNLTVIGTNLNNIAVMNIVYRGLKY